MKRLYVIVGLLIMAATLGAQIQTDIYTIQSEMDSSGASLWVDSLVTVEGVVSAGYGVAGSRNFFLQMRQSGPYSGIMVYIPSSAGDFAVQLGESLRITGTVGEFYNNTELIVDDTTNINRLGIVDPIAPIVITCDYLDTATTTTIPWDSAEAYEGVLVKVNNVVVFDTLDDYGNFQVTDGSGYVFVKNNYSYTPVLYDQLNITGIVHTDYGSYKIRPRGDEDFEFLTPGISGAFASDAQVITIIFKTPMDAGAEDGAKYSIDPTINIDSVRLDANDNHVVRLYTQDMIGGTEYTLVTVGLTDGAGVSINDTMVFYGGFTPIPTIQTDTVAGDSLYPSNWVGKTVTITGVVTANKDHFDYSFYFVQQGDSAFSGIQVWDRTGVFSPADGDSVIIVGKIAEYNGATELAELKYGRTVSQGHTVNPILVNTGDLIPGAGFTAEGYEGVLVRVENAQVTDPGTGSDFVINDGTGGVTVSNTNQISYVPSAGDLLNVTGILRYVGQLYPRGDGDIEVVGISERAFNPVKEFKISGISRNGLSFGIVLSRSQQITVSVFNITGSKVYSKDLGILQAGMHSFKLDSRFSRGVYFVNVKAGNTHLVGKTVLVK